MNKFAFFNWIRHSQNTQVDTMWPKFFKFDGKWFVTQILMAHGFTTLQMHLSQFFKEKIRPCQGCEMHLVQIWLQKGLLISQNPLQSPTHNSNKRLVEKQWCAPETHENKKPYRTVIPISLFSLRGSIRPTVTRSSESQTSRQSWKWLKLTKLKHDHSLNPSSG